MKIRRFFTLITCFALTGAVSDMTKVVNRGENVTLSAKTPNMRDVNRVTLSRSENGTQVLIFRHCSIKEKQRGCTATDDDRLKLGSDHVSVIIINASATDAGTRILEVIGNYTITETFTVEYNNGSSGDPSIKVSPPSAFNTGTIVVVIAVLIIIVGVPAVSIYLYIKKKHRQKLDSRNRTVDSEEVDTQSSIPGDERNTDASEEHCLLEKKPEDPDSTHPDALHSINNNNDSNMNYNTNNNNNDSNMNYNTNNNNDNKDVIIHINTCYMEV